ncbi:carbohydrate ABC transporter permease [Numidum massiliense]|uniref:carbohydrate ABC transporter permease n=1 Tax=Numidum massiliense TaxID=1522315 RepID=UPI0006D5991B|nr:sugar ABC transporter permease [Numidum massiliense]
MNKLTAGQLKQRKRPLGQRIKEELRRNAIVYIVLIPVLIHFAIFQLIPMIFSFILTFMDWPIIGEPRFVGLANWKELFSDGLAWKSLWNTTLFSIYYILPTMALGLILALLINSDIKFSNVYKSVFFLPVVTSFVVVSGIWGWLFRGTEYGLINGFLELLGIPTQLFLATDKQALIVLAGLSIFKVTGSTMIYYFAGLKSIPAQLYEAAKIDGASAWRTFWSVTFPLLKPIHFYVAVITTIGSFQIFDSAFILTGGGPNNSTMTIVFYLYETGFKSLRLGYASVMAYLLFFIILAITLFQRKALGKQVDYY